MSPWFRLQTQPLLLRVIGRTPGFLNRPDNMGTNRTVSSSGESCVVTPHVSAVFNPTLWEERPGKRVFSNTKSCLGLNTTVK